VIPALVDAADIPAETLASGVTVIPVLDVAGAAGGRLARRLVSVPAEAVHAGTAGPAGELWFVTAGSGSLEAGGQVIPVGPAHGIALPPGASFRLTADPAPRRSGVLTIDMVTLPGPAQPAGAAGPGPAEAAGPGRPAKATEPAQPADSGAGAPRVTDLRDCAAEVTGDRSFRVLFGPGTGYPAATQFVGEIPPGRAPDHRHAYDEVVLVLAGEGVVHLVADEPYGEVRLALAGQEAVYLGAAACPLRPGSCVHLPPGQRHCLENTGTSTLRVLGVFHPGGSPAAKQLPPR
jgi:mannose-6-phosphate isomerase-like protein (cupin superfamily)